MKKPILRILAFAALIGWMIVIFSFSAQTADSSSGESGRIISYLASIFVDGFENFTPGQKAELIESWQGAVRTLAHFTEYAVLGALAAIASLTLPLKPRRRYIGSFIFGAVYAATDELHQMAVPGRTAQLTDLITDSLGVFMGVIAVAAAIAVVRKLHERRKRKTSY